MPTLSGWRCGCRAASGSARWFRVANHGADDLLDVKPDRGGPSVLVPFTKVIVPQVQVAEGYLVVEPPDGLLDPPTPKPDEADGV